MKNYVRDILSSILAVAGGVVVYAKLQEYSWWLIGSWKGALGVLGAIGLGILLTNAKEIWNLVDTASVAEAVLWLGTGTFVVASLFVTTTETQFVVSAALVGVAWVAQLLHHTWESTTKGGHTLQGAH